MAGVLDSLTSQNTHYSHYDTNVAEELWQETPKQPDGKVMLRNYIETIAKGESIVRGQISDIERKYWIIIEQIPQAVNEEDRQNLLQDLASYTEDHKYLTLPFGLTGPRQSKALAASNL